MKPHLVLLETASNQAFIFATNRQRQQVGASELVARSGTRWLFDALASTSHPLGKRSDDLVHPAAVREALCDDGRNPPLAADGKIELLTATSGKAMLAVTDAGVARKLIADVTRRALEEAPGLTVRGVSVSYGGDGSAAAGLADAVAVAHAAMAEARSALPSALFRFLQDPLTAICADSGLPATYYTPSVSSQDPVPQSASTYCKEQAAPAGLDRMRGALTEAINAETVAVPETREERDELRRPAVLHADGNGVGRLFQLLAPAAEAVAAEGDDDVDTVYGQLCRALSCGLDQVSIDALVEALAAASGDVAGPVELLPLVLGGDDLTAIVDGPAAWPVATAYLRAYEQQTRDHAGPLGEVLEALDTLADCSEADGVDAEDAGRYAQGLTASAGFVVIPRTYPFHAAYDLAEAAVASSKTAKTRAVLTSGRGVSAVDFHVHHDRTGDELAAHRRNRVGGAGDDRIDLAGGPYLLLDGHDGLSVPAGRSDVWSQQELKRRDLARVEGWLAGVRSLMVRDDADDVDATHLSRTSVHRLREGLVGGHRAFEAARAFLRPEQQCELDRLEKEHGAVVAGDQQAGRSSILLDVLDLAGAEAIGGQR